MTISFHKMTSEQRKRFGEFAVIKLAPNHLFPPITSVDLFVTEDCTLKCDYCFVAKKFKGRKMTWEIAKKAIDFLMHASLNEPQVHITLFSGEPLLEFELIKIIMNYVKYI